MIAGPSEVGELAPRRSRSSTRPALDVAAEVGELVHVIAAAVESSTRPALGA